MTQTAHLPLPVLVEDLRLAATAHAGRRGTDDCTVVARRRTTTADAS